MANDVFANGREISCKSGSGKSICAFPDVCMTPPENPVTPPGVPVPYPNTGMASDTTDGSKSVQISGKEIMLKNKSYFKKSVGDEAGCAAKKGVVTSVNRGKVYFIAWSMDVKAEGENVVRHLDMTTHNHASPTTNTPPTAHVDTQAFGAVKGCEKEEAKAKEACAGQTTDNCSDSCRKAQSCLLVPKGKDKEKCCKPDTTGDHLIEDHWVRPGGELEGDFTHLAEKTDSGRYVKPGGPYDGAPTMCANRSRYAGKHGVAHGTRGVLEDTFKGRPFTYADAKALALQSHADACPDSGCTPSCLEAQLDHFYGNDGSKKCHTPTRQQPLRAEQREAAQARLRTRSNSSPL
jgi:hypothetical protein